MTIVAGHSQDVEALYWSAMGRVHAIVRERAQRWIEDPEIYFAPDERDRELIGAIHAARREFLKIEARYLSARGQYVMIGCVAGEHKYCKRRVERDGAILICSCHCHNQGGVS